jgi:hypothetical protein
VPQALGRYRDDSNLRGSIFWKWNGARCLLPRFWAQSSGIVSRLIGPLRPAAEAMGFAIAREDGRIRP